MAAMAERLDIRLLGELEVSRDGEPVPLPQSRKTRALLAYLALHAAPQRRDALCALLWQAPDDPRAALRWSLSKLRPVLNSQEIERLEADRERVRFVPERVQIDFQQAYETCASMNALSRQELHQLEQLFRGPFLEGLELPGQPEFETWRLGRQEQARRMHLGVLDALADKLADDPDALAATLRRRIALDPGDAKTHAALISVLARSGTRDEAERQKLASEAILNELGPYDRDKLNAALAQPRSARPSAPAPVELPLRQDIRFCTASDGVRIAYATVGSGPPLVKTANWLNHLEFDWESPVWRHVFRAFATSFTFIRYDARGNGLSDWNAEDLSLDAMVSDLEAVVDASGLERFPLLGISQGCAISIEYAVRHPERVSKLVLYGGYATGWRRRGDPERIAQSEAELTLTRMGWGKDNPAYRQYFTSCFIPDATQEQMAWFNELQRVTTSPDNAARLMNAVGDIDVTERLSQVGAPTLVVHARKDARIPLNAGRELASKIPGAKFLILESANHLLLEQEPAWARFWDEVQAFLAD